MLTHVGTQTIETERLVLRQITPQDAEMMFKNWASDDDVTRYMRWPTHKTVNDTRKITTEWCEGYSSSRKYNWGICLKDGEMIGSVGLVGIDENDSKADLGYCIGKAYWGKGYAAEAVSAVLDYMFFNVGINRIEAYHAVGNPASGRVMQKAGMTFEGHARQKYRNRDGFQDCDMYGITRADWEIKKEIAYYNSLPSTFDAFIDVPQLANGKTYLVCVAKKEAIPAKKYVPAYDFVICKGGEKIGHINLRIGYTDGLYYGGQIGYGVDEQYRGRGYAAEACRLLLPVATAHGMEKLLITNDHTNHASKRVCEKLGARFLRVAPLPEWHELYKEGQRFVNIFEWNLEE